MNTEEQNVFLLKNLNRVYAELAAYRVVVEYSRVALGEEALEKMLREARENMTLRNYVDSYCEGLAASLHLSGGIDPSQALREFLARFDGKGKPN